jgi:hypothetical protein
LLPLVIGACSAAGDGDGSGGNGGSAGGGTSGSSGAGGTAGSSGTSGTAGSAGSSGSAGNGGSVGNGGSAGQAGSAGSAGSAGQAGSAGAGGGAGGSGGNPGNVSAGETLVSRGECRRCHDNDLGGSNTFISPGVFARNITPHQATGIGSWTDEQLRRAIRDGVGKDGAPLCPTMPRFGAGPSGFSSDEAQDIVAYLRSRPAIDRTITDSTCD